MEGIAESSMAKDCMRRLFTSGRRIASGALQVDTHLACEDSSLSLAVRRDRTNRARAVVSDDCRSAVARVGEVASEVRF